MIVRAIRDCVPSAINIIVDIQTIRWSDSKTGLRYIYLTPAFVIAILLAWDEGFKPKPFKFRLRAAQITSMRKTKTVTKAGKRSQKSRRVHKLGSRKTVIESGDLRKRMRPTVIGGRAPQLTRFSNQRIFGSRKLAAFIGGADLVAMLADFAERAASEPRHKGTRK